MSDNHIHSHEHNSAPASSPEEAVALLKYMLNHNQHHAEELHELAHCFNKDAAEAIHAAVGKLQESNECMQQALKLLGISPEEK